MGHSPSKERGDGVWQTLKEHVEGVTRLTEMHVQYLVESVPEITTYAKLAGYLHDLGKYRDDFQLHRLKWHPHEERWDPTFEEKPVPHSDAGAKWLDVRLRLKPREKFGPAGREDRRELPFVIASHHGALKDIEALDDRLNKAAWEEVSPLVRKAAADIPELADLLGSGFPDLPLRATERAFLIRTLFSALVMPTAWTPRATAAPAKRNSALPTLPGKRRWPSCLTACRPRWMPKLPPTLLTPGPSTPCGARCTPRRWPTRPTSRVFSG